MTRARLIKVEFLVPEEETGDRDYITRKLVAEWLQEAYDADGGLGGNFQVTSAETIEDDAYWWKDVWGV